MERKLNIIIGLLIVIIALLGLMVVQQHRQIKSQAADASFLPGQGIGR